MNTRKALWIVVALCGCAWSQTAPAQTRYVQMVEQEPTTLTLTASAQPLVGMPVTFTATVSPASTGSVSFSLSSNSIPMQQVGMTGSGTAQWSVTFPSPGTYTVLAQYPGDLNHKPSSAVITEQVSYSGAPDFSINVSPGQTVKPGQTWTSAVQLKPINGFNGKVILSCGSGLDTTMKCNFSPASLVPASSGSTSQVSITTEATTVELATGAMLPILALWPVGEITRRRRRIASFLLCISLGLLGLGLAGCGASNHFTQTSGTTPGTYYVTVTGTSGTITHSVDVTVVVK